MDTPIVLVVEDDGPISFVVAMRLREAGLEVVTTNNGIDGLARALELRPDLVITDHLMPGMSGLELAEKLREEETTRHVPILMLTARGHKLLASMTRRTHIDAIMDKPFSPRQLVAQALDLLGRMDLADRLGPEVPPGEAA